MERRCKNRKQAPSETRCVVDDLPNDLLWLILLRLASPLWLVHAACACKRWRRVIDGGDGGRAFLRLARSLHPPVIVGHYINYMGNGGHRFVPWSLAPVHQSFNLDFFFRRGDAVQRHHTVGSWHVADCHGGLVLLILHEGFGGVSDLVICDPLSRQYRNIRHPPNQTSKHPRVQTSGHPRVFLLDGGDDDGNISLSNFRVLYCSTYFDNHNGVSKISKVYTFSTADGGDWRLVRQAFDHDRGYLGHAIGRIGRSLYLASPPSPTLRVLDSGNAMLELSKVDLPSRVRNRNSGLDFTCSTFAVVHGSSPEPMAAPATASIVHVRGDDLELFRQNPINGEWVLRHSIPQVSEAAQGLHSYPEPCRWRAVDVIAGGTRLAVLKVSLSRRCGSYTSWIFSLNVDTMQLQVASYPSYAENPKIYTLPWPQFLTDLAT